MYLIHGTSMLSNNWVKSSLYGSSFSQFSLKHLYFLFQLLYFLSEKVFLVSCPLPMKPLAPFCLSPTTPTSFAPSINWLPPTKFLLLAKSNDVRSHFTCFNLSLLRILLYCSRFPRLKEIVSLPDEAYMDPHFFTSVPTQLTILIFI